jgi:hypothetical protein
MAGVTYDTGALLAAERDDRAMWALHAGYLIEDVSPMVAAPVLAEAWRSGARQANVARLLAPCTIEPMDDVQARAVGALAGRSGHDDVVDVTVVEGAVRRGDAVVTSDPTDLAAIADVAARRVVIVAI